MLKKNRLFTPGPTPLLPQAQLAMASYSAHHRTADFRTLLTRVLADLKEFIGTQNDVLVLTASAPDSWKPRSRTSRHRKTKCSS